MQSSLRTGNSGCDRHPRINLILRLEEQSICVEIGTGDLGMGNGISHVRSLPHPGLDVGLSGTGSVDPVGVPIMLTHGSASYLARVSRIKKGH